jgi:hypothetical protein
MAEGSGRGTDDAAGMPSWSPSESPPDQATTPPATPAAIAIDRVRRLLEQLLSVPRDDQPPRPKQ